MIIVKTMIILMLFCSCNIKGYNIHIEKEKIFIGFNMSKKQIDKYYAAIDTYINKEDYNEYITGNDADKLTNGDIEKIKNDWNNENSFHLGDLYINKTRGGGYGFGKTPILPDGYINFNNYFYRMSNYGYNDPGTNYLKYWEKFVNPLQTKIGYVILENDITVYNFITTEKIAPLKERTVIQINGIPLENNFIGLGEAVSWSLNACIKIEDIVYIKELLKKVRYKIIDNKVYRYIYDLQIEIKTPILKSEDGTIYIRHDNSENAVGGFYWWEYNCDYFFDENGNFVKYGYGYLYGK
jgi:hypothetical protein